MSVLAAPLPGGGFAVEVLAVAGLAIRGLPRLGLAGFQARR
jgi:hypothetical protein